ncbi:MAG TPA: hypothetical protein VFS21_32730 [Roseiflexaceae bacterium]|nr:hypothetical protein [Roseiflexaceae bacterium]
MRALVLLPVCLPLLVASLCLHLLPESQQARFENCRFCRQSRRWGVGEQGVVWACVAALNGELRASDECGGLRRFELRPGREEDFANRLERPSEG